MKNQTYYEILGVGRHVGSGQIQAAYRFARSLYSGDATPTYGLLDAEERARMLALVEEAYAALSNPNARRDYDLVLSERDVLSPPNAVVAPAPTVAPPLSPGPSERRSTPRTPSALLPETSTTPLSVPEVVSGSALRTMRESRGLTIDQIAALSKVGSRFLKALEEDRYDLLPGRVFARGFLIEYARALRVSETEVVERYLRAWSPK